MSLIHVLFIESLTILWGQRTTSDHYCKREGTEKEQISNSHLNEKDSNIYMCYSWWKLERIDWYFYVPTICFTDSNNLATPTLSIIII